MYVFGLGTGTQSSGMSMFMGELTVLTLRALMPVHVICASLQALNWVKDEETYTLTQTRMSTIRLLLPAIVLHGLFDFMLMTMGVLVFAYQLDEEKWSGISLGLGLGITLLSLFISYKLWCRQLAHTHTHTHARGWQRVTDEGVEILHPDTHTHTHAPADINNPLVNPRGGGAPTYNTNTHTHTHAQANQLLTSTQALSQSGNAEVV